MHPVLLYAGKALLEAAVAGVKTFVALMLVRGTEAALEWARRKVYEYEYDAPAASSAP